MRTDRAAYFKLALHLSAVIAVESSFYSRVVPRGGGFYLEGSTVDVGMNIWTEYKL